MENTEKFQLVKLILTYSTLIVSDILLLYVTARDIAQSVRNRRIRRRIEEKESPK